MIYLFIELDILSRLLSPKKKWYLKPKALLNVDVEECGLSNQSFYFWISVCPTEENQEVQKELIEPVGIIFL
jgi:hypothetical protein